MSEQQNDRLSNYIQILNSIGQLRLQIKLMADDESLVRRALDELNDLENLFRHRMEEQLWNLPKD
jgi:hypothetical protein